MRCLRGGFYSFEEQVQWELEALERADLIAVYFVPGTLSPITLLELGLHARSGRLVVCCPHGYWRKGNVDIVCRRYGVATVESLQALALMLKSRVVAQAHRRNRGPVAT